MKNSRDILSDLLSDFLAAAVVIIIWIILFRLLGPDTVVIK